MLVLSTRSLFGTECPGLDKRKNGGRLDEGHGVWFFDDCVLLAGALAAWAVVTWLEAREPLALDEAYACLPSRADRVERVKSFVLF